MQNKVLAFSDSQVVLAREVEKLEKFLAKKGLFDFSFCTTSDFEQFKEFCKQPFSQFEIIVCENKKLDNLLENLKEVGDNFSLVEQQAVKLQRGETKTIFIPLEIDFQPFLENFLPLRDAFCYAIFGKRASFVEESFAKLKIDLDFDFKIFSESEYLHKVYCSKKIEKQILENVFEDCFYSEQDENLASCVQRKLKENNLTISFAEIGTNGCLVANFCAEADTSNVIKKNFVLTKNEDFENLKISKDFLLEKGVSSKECAFEMAKKLLQNFNNEIALSVTGTCSNGGRWFIALGNKDEIHLFSTAFYGNRSEILKNVTDFAFFRVLCFLNSKF